MPESVIHESKLGNGHASRSEDVRHAAEILRQSAAEMQHSSRTTSQALGHAGAGAANQVQHAAGDSMQALQQGAEVIANAQRQFAQAAQGYIEFQQRFMRNYWNVLLQGTATMLRASRVTADQLLAPVELQIEQQKRAGESHETKRAA